MQPVHFGTNIQKQYYMKMYYFVRFSEIWNCSSHLYQLACRELEDLGFYTFDSLLIIIGKKWEEVELF